MFGTEEQKEKYLVPLAKGEALGAFGLTEPNAGSDAGGTETTAVLDGDEYVINGEKVFITNASYAKTLIVTAVTGKDDRGKNIISAIIVPTDAEGLTITEIHDKMGVRGSKRHKSCWTMSAYRKRTCLAIRKQDSNNF